MSVPVQPDPGYYPALSNGYIQLYQYEPFFYRFTYSAGHGLATGPFSNTSVNLYGYLTADASGITFQGPNGYNTISSSAGETLALVDSAGLLYSNKVFAGSGRFTADVSKNPIVSNISVYANEVFTSVPFIPWVALDPATASVYPALPASLQFVGCNSSLFQLQGHPGATTASTSYLFVGSNSNSQVASSTITIQIKPERLQLSGGPTSTTLTIGTAITPVVFTATPPFYSSNLVYALPSTLPSGLGFTDISGRVVSGSFFPTDPSGTLILTGTPTIDSAISIVNSGSSNQLTSSIGVYVTSVFSGLLSNSTTLNFSYAPSVVFTTPSNNVYLPTLTRGLAITPYAFNATSVFGSTTPGIASLTAPSLPGGLSLSAVDAHGTSYLTGTPTTAGSGNYTAIAVDSNGISGSIKFNVQTLQDVVTLSSFADSRLTFVIGRPLSNALPGYYSSNLSLTATTSVGQTLKFSYAAFAAAGITATSNANVITFSGTPTVLVSPTTASVSVVDSLPSPYTASASTSVPFSVVDDVFTWTPMNMIFEQNRAVAPIQLVATTLSGRVIISYTTSGLPQGLTCTRNGLIAGTCVGGGSGLFTATASTGISTNSRLFSYSVVADALFLATASNSYSLVPGADVSPIPTIAESYSGTLVTSYSLTAPSYGLTINSSSGVISGTLYSGSVAGNQQLYASVPIVVNAVAGIVPISTTFTLSSSKIVVNGQLSVGDNVVTPLYTAVSSPAITGAAVGTSISGSTLANPYADIPTAPYADIPTASASDAQVNGSNAVVSLSQLGDYGSTIFGSVVYGDVAIPTMNLATGFPTQAFVDNVSNSWTLYRSAFSVAYSGSGSTWYALGYGYNTQAANPSSNFGQVYLIVSSNNGQTWTPGYYTNRTPANWALAVNNPTILSQNSFFAATLDQTSNARGAVVLRRSGTIYMAGGGNVLSNTMIRITSMTGGTPPTGDNATIVPAWTYPTGGFKKETRDFALDGSPWVAAGSDSNAVYRLPVTACTTLKWSSDSGATWSNATNDFGYTGIAVAYGSNSWAALGQDTSDAQNNDYCALKTSTDGKAWSSPIEFTPPLSRTSTIIFTNSQWILSDGTRVYTNTPNFSAGWTLVSSPLSNSSILSRTFNLINPYNSNSVLTTTPRDPAIQLVSPASYNYAVMQYTAILPIVLTLNQTTAYYFLATDTLPRGISFDPLTGTFSGMPVLTGKYSVRIYATAGGTSYNYFDFSFEVFSPYPQKRQDTASAYTAYVRQEAIIAGAQFSRDSTAFPSENTTIGAAMGPAPPEIQTATPACCPPN